MKNMINPSIRTMATKLRSGIVTPSQCTRILSACRRAWLLLIAGLLPMIAAAQPTGITLSLEPAAVTESSAATTITLTVTLVGGTFGEDRRVVVTPGGGTATFSTDYTVPALTTFTIPENTASVTTTISFMAPIDTDDELGGETAVIEAGIYLSGNIRPLDPSIPVTRTTITINDYTPVVVSAGADQRVAPGGTIMLNGTITSAAADATITVAWALSDSDAATAALEAAGVSSGDAATEVTRLTTALALITTPPVATLPAPAESLGLTDPVLLAFTLTVTDSTAPAGQTATDDDEVVITVDGGPVFTNEAAFATPIEVAENTTAVGDANFFTAPALGSGTVTLMPGGTDAALFSITPEGTLTFVAAPNFEMPRGMALSGTNTNSYVLTVTAMNSFGMKASGPITVTVTDVNEAPPVLDAILTPTFTEHTAGGFTITATDEDAGQMLTFTLTGETHGATIATGGGFSWTPGEDDGGVERVFTVTVTDDGTPPMMASTTFAITATEPNRIPTFGNATIDDQTYTQGTEITSLTLPAATGGDGTITYTLSPAPPAGLSFDPGTRELTGTPTAVATAADYTYTAADADDNMAADDAATLTFTITVSPMVTGIDDLTDGTFNIYPNPVSGRLTVERKGIARDEISIHDFTGKRIHVPVRQQSPRKVVLDVSGLAGGMYLVKVSGAVQRLIVEHRQERF